MSASPSIAKTPLASSSYTGQTTSPSYAPGGFGSSKKRRPEEDEHTGPRRFDEDEDGMEGSRVIAGRKGVKRARATRNEGGPTAEVDHGDNSEKMRHQDVDVGVLLGGFSLETIFSRDLL